MRHPQKKVDSFFLEKGGEVGLDARNNETIKIISIFLMFLDIFNAANNLSIFADISGELGKLFNTLKTITLIN